MEHEVTPEILPEQTVGGFVTLDDLALLYEAHHASLVRLAHLLTGSISTGEEVVQDSFIKVHNTSRVIADPSAYLRRVVVNESHTRSRRRTVESAKLRLIGHRRQLEPLDVADHIDETWHEVIQLPSKQRAVLVLRFYEDLSTTDTAEILGIPEGSVKSLVHRGLKRLRERLPEQ